MAVKNLRGTSQPHFRIGLDGPVLYQGTDNPVLNPPTPIDQFQDGDVYVRRGTGQEGLFLLESGDWYRMPSGGAGGTFEGPVAFLNDVDGVFSNTGGFNNFAPNPNFQTWVNTSGTGTNPPTEAVPGWYLRSDEYTFEQITDTPDEQSEFALRVNDTQTGGHTQIVYMFVPPRFARHLIGRTLTWATQIRENFASAASTDLTVQFATMDTEGADLNPANMTVFDTHSGLTVGATYGRISVTTGTTIPSSAQNGLVVILDNAVMEAGDSYDLAQVGLYVGSHAPDFEAPNVLNPNIDARQIVQDILGEALVIGPLILV